MEPINPSPGESLKIINDMIDVAKNEFSDNGAFYLLWGWAVFITAALHYILIRIGYEHPYIVWAVIMPLAGIISLIISWRHKRKSGKRSRTWFDRILFYVWTAFGASLLIVLFTAGEVGWEHAYPVMIILYAIGTYISGGVMKFRPLIAGGIASWIIGAFAFFVSFEWQLILLAAAILVSYIIPGHILAAKYQRHVSGT